MTSLLTKIYFPALILLFCILRLITLDLQPLSLDELTTVNLISSDKGLSFILDWIRLNDTQLPLYYIIQYFVYHFIGESVFVLRLPSLIFSLLGVYFYYAFIKKNKGKETSQFVSLFLLSSFMMTFHSQEIRPYGLLFLLSTLSFTLSGVKSKKKIFYLTLFMLSITHYFGLALSIIQLVIKGIENRKENSLKKMSLVLLPCLILVYFFGKDFYTDLLVIHPFRDHLSIINIINTIIYILGGKFLAASLIFVIGHNIFKDKKLDLKTQFYLPCLILVLLVTVKSLLTTPVVEARYFIGLMLPLSLAFSQHLKSRYMKILIICLALYNTYFHEKILETPYRLATRKSSQYINTNYQGTRFVTSCDINLSYYIPRFQDCYHKACELPDDVIYITMDRNHYECPTYKTLIQTHNNMDNKIFKGLKVHYYKKK